MLEDDTSETTLNGDEIRLSVTERYENKREEFKNWFENEKSDLKRAVGVSILVIVAIVITGITTAVLVGFTMLLDLLFGETISTIFIMLVIIYVIVYGVMKLERSSRW